jgi:3-dehydroquinate dehydratase type I
MLVKEMKKNLEAADVFEIWLDDMRVKGDLAVIQKFFKKPLIAKSDSLDMLKRGVKAGMTYVDVPHGLPLDSEFRTLVKNKGTKVIVSYHNYEVTPTYNFLLDILEEMRETSADFFKIATHIHTEEDEQKLFDLLKELHFRGRLIVTGMGDNSRRVRIQAPVRGSVFYYAPINATLATAAGQLTRAELEKEWRTI